MTIRYPLGLLAIALLALHGPAVAEDIDLFIGAGFDATDKPNVLLVIDNAANFSSNADNADCEIDGVPTLLSGTVGGIEQCALHTVISGLPDDSVNIGVMVYNASNVVDYMAVDCVQIPAQPGGCLVYPITPMTATNKVVLLDWIESWKTSGSGAGYIKANAQATGAVMQEAWAYYFGRTGLSTRDYEDIKPASGCQKNYVIFIGNSFGPAGTPGDQTGNKGPKSALENTNSTEDMNARSPVATATQRSTINRTILTSCGTATLGTPHENKGFYADEWARYMKGQEIVTYTIGLLGPSCQASYSATLDSMATVGDGKYFPTNDYAELVLAVSTALSEIQSVNSVFASVSLPVSVNTEGTYLNQVYIGMFRPDENALPRWAGNLKQYRLAAVGTQLKLVDAYDPSSSSDPYHPAISNAGTGFIAECARSYWTPSADDSYWAPMTAANCVGHPAASNAPDGNVVEKGAQGYVLRGSATATSVSRTMRTCSTEDCTALADFASASISKTLLGDALMSDDDRDDLIEWAIGTNNKTGEENFVVATAMRPSVHGDVVHSRPVALDFRTAAEATAGDPPQVVVVYGGNDGVLRAINGNRTDVIGSVGAGHELWSFMPPEFYPHIKRLRDNTTQVSYEGNNVINDGDILTPEPEPKPYGIDGPITVYRDGTNTTWVYTTMRRGGRSVYAFDMSTIDSSPTSPSLMWKRGCTTLTSDTGCDSGAGDISDIGQTWSAPKVFKSEGYASGSPSAPQPMLIMGGGYDNCEDDDPHGCNAMLPTDPSTPYDLKGNHIYVMDAATGALLQTFDTDRGVVGDVFVVTDTVTNLAKWAYAADLGGNIYRISGSTPYQPIGSTVPGLWTMTKIASLGCDNPGTSCSPTNRKFMFSPDVVEQNGIYYLLIGSGDREKPLDDWATSYDVDNYFFMLQDAPTLTTWLTDEQDECSAHIMCLDSLVEIAVDAGNPDPDVLAAKKGWYLGLHDHEQVVTSAITVFGTTTFSTHTPTPVDPDACASDLGTARVYNVGYSNAASQNGTLDRSEQIDGGGLPPSPVAGMVTLDGNPGQTVPFIIGSEANSPLEGFLPTPSTATSQPKGYNYWFIRK